MNYIEFTEWARSDISTQLIITVIDSPEIENLLKERVVGMMFTAKCFIPMVYAEQLTELEKELFKMIRNHRKGHKV